MEVSKVALLLSKLGAREACDIADEFLANEVGNLLMASDPVQAQDGCWEMSITLGNAVRGVLGEVGTIRVDSSSGRVLFPDDERTKVKERARSLYRASAPSPGA